MGTWPTFWGKVVVSFPEGFTSQIIHRLSRLPLLFRQTKHSVWRAHGLLSHFMASGRPVNNTSTTGFPVSNRASNNLRCVSGIRISVRLEDSPLISDDSPSAATITSALVAMANASSSNDFSERPSRLSDCQTWRPVLRTGYRPIRFDPLAYNIFPACPLACCSPSLTVTDAQVRWPRSRCRAYFPGYPPADRPGRW